MKRNILRFTLTVLTISCGFVSVHGQTTATAQKPIERRVVHPPGVQPPPVPISPAIVAGDFVFTSGHLGIDPKTGQMAPGGVAAEAEQALKNLTAILEAAGSSMSHVLKTTVFLADMNDYAVMNEVYRRHFSKDFPARSAIQVAKLPANGRIEIEAVAILKK